MAPMKSQIALAALFLAYGCALDAQSDPEAAAGDPTTVEVDESASERAQPSVPPEPGSCARYQTIVIGGYVARLPVGCTLPGPDRGDPAPLGEIRPRERFGNPSPYAEQGQDELRNPPPEELPRSALDGLSQQGQKQRPEE
jgi:hypothetical protein